MLNPMYAELIARPTRTLATSALPDAPVVPDRAHRSAGRTATVGPARRATAGLLRQLADRVEPRPALG